MRLNFSGTGLLVFTSLLAGAAPTFSQTPQRGIKKQESGPGDSIQEKVRRALGDALEDEDKIRELFVLGNKAVPTLIKFLSDPGKDRRAGAARGLAYIGNQQGMQAIRNALKAEKDEETGSAMSCFLAGALVQTKSASDLDFLSSSVERARFTDDDEKDFRAICAALALGMMGRSDSLPILRKAARADLLGAEEIGKAIRWIERKPAPWQPAIGPSLSDKELIKRTVLDGTLFAQEERSSTSVEEITFNLQRRKALVSLEIYHGPKSARGYDLVLNKENGAWIVVGIWFAWVA